MTVTVDTENAGIMLAGSTAAAPSTSDDGGHVLPTETEMVIKVGIPVCMEKVFTERAVYSGDSESLHQILEEEKSQCVHYFLHTLV